MNRTRINGAVLGVGTHAARASIAATQIIELVGSLRTSLVKYGQVAASLTMLGSIRLKQQVAISAESSLTLSGQLACHVRQRSYASATQFSALISTLSARVKTPLKGLLLAALQSGVSPTIRHHIHSTETLVLALESDCYGLDVYFGYAPDARFVAISAAPRSVAVPGSDNNAGV
jgi:hypothetical protein